MIGYGGGVLEGGLEVLDTRAEVETPERVRFRHQLAGPGRRGVAWLIDLILRLLVAIVLLVPVALVSTVDLTLGGGAVGLYLVLVFVFEWLYGAIFEIVLSGRTPGKLVMDLRVVRTDGSPIRPADAVLRNLLRAVDFLPVLGTSTFVVPTFGVGLLVMILDRKMRRLGDLVAGTVVVVDVRQDMQGGVGIDPPVTEEERQGLPARVDLGPDELDILESFVRRRHRLSADRVEELAELYGPALSARTGIEAPTWERVLVLAYAKATGKDR